jgi:hypothetical protein
LTISHIDENSHIRCISDIIPIYQTVLFTFARAQETVDISFASLTLSHNGIGPNLGGRGALNAPV